MGAHMAQVEKQQALYPLITKIIVRFPLPALSTCAHPTQLGKMSHASFIEEIRKVSSSCVPSADVAILST